VTILSLKNRQKGSGCLLFKGFSASSLKIKKNSFQAFRGGAKSQLGNPGRKKFIVGK
jgi:hypothetical protein